MNGQSHDKNISSLSLLTRHIPDVLPDAASLIAAILFLFFIGLMLLLCALYTLR